MEGITKPDVLDLKTRNHKESWKLFKQMWMNYEVATGLNEAKDEKRVATLLTMVGRDALRVYNTFKWTEKSESKKIETVVNKFEEYCNPKCNETYERYIFNNRKQEEGETIDDFVVSLKTLSENCNYGTIQESLIRDIMIIGLRDDRLRESLLRDPDLTLETALNRARAAESSQIQNRSLNKGLEQEEAMNRVYKKKDQHNFREGKTEITCWFCGNQHSKGRWNCPAYGNSCRNCKKTGHFAKVCKNGRRSDRVNNVNEENHLNETMEDLYIE